MFNATVAGTTRKFLKSHCVKKYKQGSRGGSRFDINEMEWGTKRNIKVGREKNTCNFMLMYLLQIVLNPGELLLQNDQVDEKSWLRLHQTTIILVIFIVIIIISIVLIIYVALGGWNDHIG